MGNESESSQEPSPEHAAPSAGGALGLFSASAQTDTGLPAQRWPLRRQDLFAIQILAIHIAQLGKPYALLSVYAKESNPQGKETAQRAGDGIKCESLPAMGRIGACAPA
jgi:hypothetical protein